VRESRMLGSVRAKAEWLSYSTNPRRRRITSDLRFRKLCEVGVRGSVCVLGSHNLAKLGKACLCKSFGKRQKKPRRTDWVAICLWLILLVIPSPALDPPAEPVEFHRTTSRSTMRSTCAAAVSAGDCPRHNSFPVVVNPNYRSRSRT
jgi:hypothetical protein